ncbi:MAG: hypothetical protein AB7S81_00225 [Bdellovibrionales bacterium]
MSSVTAQLYLDLSHRCLRETLALLREGRLLEVFEVACVAADLYEKAIPNSDEDDNALFISTALRTPHPSERQAKKGA